MAAFLKLLFLLTFATYQDSKPVEVHRIEAEAEAAQAVEEIEIDIDDIRMMEKGEMPEKLKGLELREVNPKIEE